MSGPGGARPGAGRPQGSVNRRSAETLALAMAEGLSPIEYMLEVLRDEEASPKDRQWAAERSAPFVHPRPAPEPRRIEIKLPDTGTIDGVKEAARAVIQATANGTIAPAEAQSLISVLEVQRKAIETEELIARIEKLEAEAAERIGTK